MNIYKEEWLLHINMLKPVQTFSDAYRNELERQEQLDNADQLAQALIKTGRAVAAGVAISAIDGPLPVMDVIGLTVAVGGAGVAWLDYLFN